MPAPDAPIRYPERLRVRAPRGFAAAIEVAARRRHTSPSELMRQAILRALEQEGVQLRDGQVFAGVERGLVMSGANQAVQPESN